MSAQATGVIDLISSDDEDDPVDENDEVQVVGVVQPTKRRMSSQPCLHQKKLKRPRESCSDDENASAGQTIDSDMEHSKIHLQRVMIDDDRLDDGIVTPGTVVSWNESAEHSVFCTAAQHIQQRDKWSCGYRNLQMTLSAILPRLPADHSLFRLVPRREDCLAIPSVRQIQRAIEQSWKEGFDARGAQHFRGKMDGKKAWIGAVEVSSIFSFWGFDAAVVQFIRCQSSRLQLFEFVSAYFSRVLGREACPFCALQKKEMNAAGCSSTSCGTMTCARRLLDLASAKNELPSIEPECACPLLPLYLQWEGHSVSIVGVDQNKNDPSFLAFDPMKKVSITKIITPAGKLKTEVNPSKIPVRMLVKTDTQVVILTNLRSMSEREKASRKGYEAILTAAEKDVLKTWKTKGEV